ncbi:MAG: ABC transporter permease [Candidatus Methanomethylophilus sp.]|nr:ABC transporter permease [Methanomethylophilus sp.]MDD4222062.1 ABC transporter permease [Methanomethylophilus sp.]MDD4668530.1 ABC transporter permease [Methanomethylophilus sp.]
MSVIPALVRRHCLIFFRDRMNVFFSMLGAIIVLLLYITFLKNLMIQSVPGEYGSSLMDSWIIAGILAVTSVTAALGSLGILVSDKTSGASKIVTVSPVKPIQVAASYIISSFLITMMLGIFVLMCAEVFIAVSGGPLLSAVALLEVLGVMIAGTASSCSIMFFVATLLKTTESYSTACVIVGTLVGFVAGTYIPMGTLPEAMRNVVMMMPVSHEGMILRQIFMDVPEGLYFEGASADAVHQFNVDMGYVFNVGGTDLSIWISLLFLVGTAALFLLLSSYMISRKKD